MVDGRLSDDGCRLLGGGQLVGGEVEVLGEGALADLAEGSDVVVGELDAASGLVEADDEGGLEGLDLRGGLAQKGAAELFLALRGDGDVQGGCDGADEMGLALKFGRCGFWHDFGLLWVFGGDGEPEAAEIRIDADAAGDGLAGVDDGAVVPVSEEGADDGEGEAEARADGSHGELARLSDKRDAAGWLGEGLGRNIKLSGDDVNDAEDLAHAPLSDAGGGCLELHGAV